MSNIERAVKAIDDIRARAAHRELTRDEKRTLRFLERKLDIQLQADRATAGVAQHRHDESTKINCKTRSNKKGIIIMGKTELEHEEGCKKSRIETYVPDGTDVTVTRCLDCGAHRAVNAAGVVLKTPVVTGGMSGYNPDAGWVQRGVND